MVPGPHVVKTDPGTLIPALRSPGTSMRLDSARPTGDLTPGVPLPGPYVGPQFGPTYHYTERSGVSVHPPTKSPTLWLKPDSLH